MIWTVAYSVPFWFIIFFLFFMLVLFIFIIWGFMRFLKPMFNDMLIFIDKNFRWTRIYARLKGAETYTYKDKSYHLHEDGSILNRKGKAMFIFTENVPTPLKIQRNKTEWLSSDSLDAVLKNKIVQQIVKPTDKFIDMLIILGSVGGILAALSSIIILLITLGIIKPT